MGRGVQGLEGMYAIRREQKFAPPPVLAGAQIPSTTTASLWRERVAWRSKPTHALRDTPRISLPLVDSGFGIASYK